MSLRSFPTRFYVSTNLLSLSLMLLLCLALPHSARAIGNAMDGQSQTPQVGDKQVGDKQGGDKQVGDKQGGDKQVGDKQGGDKQVGDKQGGDKQGGDKQVGDKQGGDKQVGDKQVGDKQGGDKQGTSNKKATTGGQGTGEATPDSKVGAPAGPQDKQKTPLASSPQDAAKPGTAEAPDNRPPAVTGGTPTITDTAALTLPGWVECDPGSLKNLNRDRILGTPFLLKVTAPNQRLQYRLASDGYVRLANDINSYGDTYAGLHYLIASQEKVGFDVAGRFTVKIPTADPQVGGTKKFDYYGLFLGSRDFTKWGLHGDFNLGLSSLTRPEAGGSDQQYLLSGALTVPIRGGRWQYTNELVYLSPIAGQRYRITTMHGFAFANHRYEVYSAALQWQLHGNGPTFQLLVAGSFFLTKLF